MRFRITTQFHSSTLHTTADRRTDTLIRIAHPMHYALQALHRRDKKRFDGLLVVVKLKISQKVSGENRPTVAQTIRLLPDGHMLVFKCVFSERMQFRIAQGEGVL